MKKTGIILELAKTRAILLTSQAEFVTTKSKPGMFIGQQVDLSAPLGNWFGVPRYRYAFGTIACLIIFIVSFLVLSGSPCQSGLYAYVSVDINPSIEFAVNRQMRVLNVNSINKDGLQLLQGMHLNDISLNKALISIVAKAEQNSYFRNSGEKYMLISVAAARTNQVKPEMKSWLAGLRQKLTKRNIQVYFIESTLKQRNLALKNGLSMGRYELYIRAHDAGRLLTRDEVQTISIFKLLNRAGIIHNDPNNASPALTGTKSENVNKDQNVTPTKNDSVNPENRQENGNIDPGQDKPETNDKPENTALDNNLPVNDSKENTLNIDITGSENQKDNSGSTENDPNDNSQGNNIEGGSSGGGSSGGSGGSSSGSGGSSSGSGGSSGGGSGGSGGRR